MKVHPVEQFVFEATLKDALHFLHHVLQLRNSRIYSDECNLQSCTYSADHRVQGHLKLPADLEVSNTLQCGPGQIYCTLCSHLFTLFCWSWCNLMFKAVTNGSATVSMINLATWQNRDSRRMESLNLRPGLRYTGTVGNSGCLAVMLGGNCW